MTEATRTSRATTTPSVQPDQAAKRSKATTGRHSSHRALAGAIARWTLAILAVLWLSFCTAIGPFYWYGGSIADWGFVNTIYFLLALAIYLMLLIALVHVGGGLAAIPSSVRSACRRVAAAIGTFCHTGWRRNISKPWHALARLWRRFTATRFAHAVGRCWTAVRTYTPRIIMRCTRSWIGLALIMFIGWLWVPVTLLSAFGADIRSQVREFSWAWNQWTGLQQPYTGFFAFVPMDIYPTAHYLWPQDPTYLTDQHNLVLTVFYGAVAAASRYFTGSNDAGYVVLSSLQFLFAVFCCSATMHRFLNLPWLGPESGKDTEATVVPNSEPGSTPGDYPHAVARAGVWQRTIIILFFLLCPIAVFSTISLTKSPLFAFAFVWWFGIAYQLHMTRVKRGETPRRLPARTLAAFIASACVMLISAKYAWYILLAQTVIMLITDRGRWKTYIAALLLPAVILHGGLVLLVSTGKVINGDPIESRGIQLQQIARVARRNPEGIPKDAADKLAPIFNLDQMGESYFQQDADPVKSSGIQSKKVSYRWRSVTKEDMADFNSAWWQIVKANPVIAADAFFAECFGYFDIADLPYVSMDYYVTSDYVVNNTEWIKDWQPQWRENIARFARDWGKIPVLGWVTHGNFYVILTLLFGAAEVVRHRWRTLAWHMPLLLLMGVMITSPANNFERHMLPLTFVFCFVALTYWRESRGCHETRIAGPEDSAGGHHRDTESGRD
ncbi:DUF6020 family protein [Bifidobacterium thermophilum]|uniref:DUF6020 family protein n=1 Tax=Bifidobacterium thermophilum TaxID=33905 RepID=UPI003992C60D